MQNTEAPSPLDFLARFAGPLAWLVAGLLLLFGGVGGAGPAGPGGVGSSKTGPGEVRDTSTLRFLKATFCGVYKEGKHDINWISN